MSRVTAYPAGGVHVGQALGFDAAATDPQQPLADTAYSFVMQRQDCATCPRVDVARWDHVRTGGFVVPQLTPDSHLYLVATVTDDQGATSSRTLQLDPQPVSLVVTSTPGRAGVHIAQTSQLVMGSTVQVSAPRSTRKNGVKWVFVRWSDGGARTHAVTVWDPSVELTAVYKRKRRS